MNLQNDFNKLDSKIQEVFENWDNKILPHLPQQMDEMAKRTGALHRKRGVCSSVISDTAWRKRFSKASPFLHEILHSLLSAFLPGADVILRITPKNFCLYDAQREKISLTALVKDAEEKHMEWIDVFGFCKYKGKTGFVRVIAHRLPDGQAAKARKRKTRKASKNQRRIQAETLLSAGWITVVTSLGAEYSGEEILHLYRSRWQVELLFKRLKQNFSIHTIKAGSSVYAETETLLWLIIWTIAERQSFQAECFLAKKRECSYSIYEKCKISFMQITDILRLSWSLFVDLTDKRYTRYLSKKQRRRINQNDEFYSVVLPGLLS